MQTKLGEMQIELADRGIPAIDVDGYADIAGTLSITSPSGISSPAVGTSWDLLRYSPQSELGNRFRIAVLPGIGAGKYLRVNYTENLRSTLTISVSVNRSNGLLDLAETSSMTGAATVGRGGSGFTAGPPDGYDVSRRHRVNGEVYVFINDGNGGIDKVTFMAGNRPTVSQAATSTTTDSTISRSPTTWTTQSSSISTMAATWRRCPSRSMSRPTANPWM